MRKTFAAILATLCLSWLTPAHTEQVNNDLNKTVAYSSLNKKTKQQIECLAQNVYFEAGHESQKGQMAVALVTLNRAEYFGNPHDICGVVKMKTESTCQFTWWCDSELRDKALHLRFSSKEMDLYNEVRKVALYTYINYENMTDVTKGAFFYHADYVNPHWKYRKTVQIGRHIFYKRS
jgi:spore germination cell wall hydrolase CwlJ-like protein